MKRTLSRAIAAATFSIIATAALANNKTTLVIQYPYPSLSAPVHKKLAEQFKAVQPDVTIRYIQPAADHKEALQSVLRGAITGEMPDISFQGTNLAQTLVDKGLAVSMDECLEPEIKEFGYGEWAQRMGRFNGKLYSLPFGLTAPVLYINADLLKKAGVDPDVIPTSWADVMADGAKIEKVNGTIGFIYLWNLTGDFMFQNLLFAHGGSMMSSDNKVAFDSKAGLAALRDIQRFGRSGMPDMTYAQADQAFLAGTVGILANTTAFAAGFQKTIDGKFDMRLWPMPRAASGLLPSGGNLPIVLTKDKAKLKAACEYMRFIAGPEGQKTMVEGMGYLTASDTAIKDPRYLKSYVANHKLYSWTLKQLPHMTAWFGFPSDNALKIQDVILKGMESVFLNKVSPEDAMAKMKQGVERFLKP